MFDWIWQNIILNSLWFTLEVIPWWVWVIAIVLAAAWVWRTFGWQGLVGLGLLVLSAGSYRQGWRDARSKKKPLVPVGDNPFTDLEGPDAAPPVTRRVRKPRTVLFPNAPWNKGN